MNSTPFLAARRWLVVDDNANIAWMLSLMLQRMGLGEGSQFCSARAAFQHLRDGGDFDLVILDRHTAELNGIEFARWVRAVCPQARIVLMSGSVEEFPEGELRSAGIDAVLEKPFTLLKFERLVTSLLAGAEANRHAA